MSLYGKELSELEPEKLWSQFEAICNIPHCSKKEEQLREYIIKLARENGAGWSIDATGNLLVKVAPTGKNKGAPLILQCHLDMVCEKKSDFSFDFDHDPIAWEIDEDYVVSRNTTLGADNGIGVAACCALIQDHSILHGGLELLFTVEEEIGLFGAGALEEGWLTGDRMINLDSEDEDYITVGCAGGENLNLLLPFETDSGPEKRSCLKVTVQGGLGGHSGIDIHKGRANAIQILSTLLQALTRKTPFQLCQIKGGDKFNAIPRDAEALLVLPAEKEEVFRDGIAALGREIMATFSGIESEITVSVTTGVLPESANLLSVKSSKKIVRVLNALPHGVLRMNSRIPGMVETSINLATIQLQEQNWLIETSLRFGNESDRQTYSSHIESIGELAGAVIEKSGYYPGWKSDPANELVSQIGQIYGLVYGREAKLLTIHAGLECGLIGKKYPHLPMISIGPNIHSPHAPGEKISIPSTKRFWNFLCQILQEV